MRTFLSTTLLSLMSSGLFAQTLLTSQNNALIMGESLTYNEIQFVDPGNNGPDQLWDFSKIQFTEKNPVTSFQPPFAQKIEGIASYNLSLEEDGYNYFMNSTGVKLEELGYVNTEKNMTLVYSDPILKLKYPFAYGEQFTDPFVGVAYFSKDYKIELSGDHTSTADAWGTLIMPDRIIKNALRVKSVKQSVQVNRCGSTKVNVTKYTWYAEGYRYPVLNISITEKIYPSNLTPEITKTASVYTPQVNIAVKNDAPGNSGISKQISNAGVSVILYPNPFSEKITYNYFLKSSVPVSIMLYDVTGKCSEKIVDNQVQAEGFHTGELDGLKHTLPVGVYYLRFVFDEQIVVSKVVKLENK